MHQDDRNGVILKNSQVTDSFFEIFTLELFIDQELDTILSIDYHKIAVDV